VNVNVPERDVWKGKGRTSIPRIPPRAFVCLPIDQPFWKRLSNAVLLLLKLPMTVSLLNIDPPLDVPEALVGCDTPVESMICVPSEMANERNKVNTMA
jgi:hypothetical protein